MQTLTLIQHTLITDKPFFIDDTKNLSFPMPPLTTAFSYIDNGVKKIKIRTILFIDSLAVEPSLNFHAIEDKDVVKISSDYKFQENTPISFNCYYVELDYFSEQVDNINTIISYLVDLDPRTSRGTYTSVYSI